MAETKTTTTPRRARTATTGTATPRKPAARKPAAVTEETATVDVKRFTVALENTGDTKNFAKFTMPDGVPCKGTLYVPLGATEVRVLVIGTDANDSDGAE